MNHHYLVSHTERFAAKDNPTLKTLLAVIKGAGLRLSVVADDLQGA